MNQSIKTLLFAVGLGVVCSTLLVGVTLLTRPFREANEQAERVRNTLIALEAPVSGKTPAAELLALFQAEVREQQHSGLSAYAWYPDGAQQPVAVAIPFAGAGVWGPVEGVLALEPDMQTIRGVRFYKQEETPGLGGEIGSDRFQDQFRGKKIVSASGIPGIRVLMSGAETDPNAVHAITGATMTSDRVEEMLNTVVLKLHGGKDERP